MGAVRFYALDTPMLAALRFSDADVVDPSHKAVLLIGKPIRMVAVRDVRPTSAGDP